MEILSPHELSNLRSSASAHFSFRPQNRRPPATQAMWSTSCPLNSLRKPWGKEAWFVVNLSFFITTFERTEDLLHFRLYSVSNILYKQQTILTIKKLTNTSNKWSLIVNTTTTTTTTTTTNNNNNKKKNNKDFYSVISACSWLFTTKYSRPKIL